MKKTAVSRVGHSENALGDFRIIDQARAANCRPPPSPFCPLMQATVP
jgi:hypothetical protein